MTKLTKDQKAERRVMLADFKSDGGKVWYFPGFGITVAAVPAFANSRTAFISVSMAAQTETKFRRKVGEYHALRRQDAGTYWNIPFNMTDDSAYALAETLACM